MAYLTCEQVELAYEGVPVVTDLSFVVNQGDYLCVVGENGSGKSTLIKALLGLKKPSAGKITFSGGLSQRDIGYLPQQTPAQADFPASAFEVVLSGCLNRLGMKPFYGKAEKERAMANLRRLSAEHLADSCYRDLSGGQKQRVLLARALCATEKVLLLDEPVTGLDPAAVEDMYQLIKKLNCEDGITVIMVSHDIHGALRQASHILHLHNRPLFFGTAAEYRESGASGGVKAAEGRETAENIQQKMTGEKEQNGLEQEGRI